MKTLIALVGLYKMYYLKAGRIDESTKFFHIIYYTKMKTVMT